MKHLTTPLSFEDIAGLQVGELVTLSGGVWTGRAGVCKRIVEGQGPPSHWTTAATTWSCTAAPS